MNSIISFVNRWYSEGLVYHGSPFCMYYPPVNDCLNSNDSCDKAGACGISLGTKYRSEMMFVSFWISVVMMIFLTVGWASLGVDDDTVKNTFWVKGVGTIDNKDRITIEMYMGLRYITGDISAEGVSEDFGFGEKWTSDKCPLEFCSDCGDSSKTTMVTVIMAMITEIPAITTKLTRSHPDSDTNCQKWMGIITTIFSMVTTLACLSDFASVCFRQMPSNFDLSDDLQVTDVEYTWGPGMVLVLLATLLKVPDIIFMCIIPVGQKQNKEPMGSREEKL